MSLGQPRNHGCRISDEWTFKGMRTLILENSLLRIVILLDKGSDIIEFRYKPRDLDFIFLAPGGIQNPSKTTPSAYSHNPFIDYYAGGWNDILPNGGPFVNYEGAELGQHAEISLLPWEYALLEDNLQRVAVRLWVRGLRTPFFVEKTLSLEPDQARLSIEESVTNEAGVPMHMMWGQHIAFSREFLHQGAVIDAPAKQFIVHEAMPGFQPRRFSPGETTVWPSATNPDGILVDASIIPPVGSEEAQEMAYLSELEDGWYALTNLESELGFGVRFDHELFPYVWYWQQLNDTARDFPWWGRYHTTALEPWTSYPTSGLLEAIENGTALKLEPGEKIETSFMAVVYEGGERVERITPEGIVIRQSG